MHSSNYRRITYSAELARCVLMMFARCPGTWDGDVDVQGGVAWGDSTARGTCSTRVRKWVFIEDRGSDSIAQPEGRAALICG